MRLKLATAFTIATLAVVVSFSGGLRGTPTAAADGPIGGVDPVTGGLLQTFTFGYVGFQPYTPLTLSFLPPGAPAFTIIDTPVPVVTDGAGQALIPLSIPSLVGGDASAVAQAGYDPTQVATLASLITISWGYGPLPGGVGSFRFDACDTINCVDLVGTIYYFGP